MVTRSTQAHVASRRERYKYEMLLAAVTTQCHKYQSPIQQALHIVPAAYPYRSCLSILAS